MRRFFAREHLMSISRWIANNTASLAGKRVAVFGSTGGIGKPLCEYLASLGASLILINRNIAYSEIQRYELLAEYSTDIKIMICDLADFQSVKSTCEELKNDVPDVIIHNAGAYKIPRNILDTGLDNAFQINFASPYYITRELLPFLREKQGRVVAVGSIAHDYSKSDPNDVDFRSNPRASRVYGNAKRYLMCSLWSLFKDEKEASLSIAHPGITFTNITAHYPPVIFALIKHPMKVIFMRPRKACLSILRGVFDPCGYREWIGPRLFDVWGYPKKKQVNTCDDEEIERIAGTADEVYERLSSL